MYRSRSYRDSVSEPPAGIFAVSIDLELAWAGCDIPLTEQALIDLRKEREIVAELLRRLSRLRSRASGESSAPSPNSRSNSARGSRMGGSGCVSLRHARLFV